MNSEMLKDSIELDRAASFWLKKAIVTAEGRDCVDALHDAQALLEYCQLRVCEARVQS